MELTLSIENSNVEFSGYQTIDFRDGKILDNLGMGRLWILA